MIKIGSILYENLAAAQPQGLFLYHGLRPPA
jgi:hypothetical protein